MHRLHRRGPLVTLSVCLNVPRVSRNGLGYKEEGRVAEPSKLDQWSLHNCPRKSRFPKLLRKDEALWKRKPFDFLLILSEMVAFCLLESPLCVAEELDKKGHSHTIFLFFSDSNKIQKQPHFFGLVAVIKEICGWVE